MSSPVRVLQIVTAMNRGGLESMLMNYYRNIDCSKVQFDFLVHRYKRADYDDEIETSGGKICRMPILNPFSKKYKKSLRQFFSGHPEYRIIHVHQDCLSSIILKTAKESGVPVRIAHSHCANQDKNWKYPVKMFFKRFIPQYATHLFACGEDAGNWMFGGAGYDILNNAIETKNYVFCPVKRGEQRKKLGIDNFFTIGLTARFSPQKNHSFLIDIFSEILKKEPAARLLLVGDGELRSAVEKKVTKLGISENVIFTGVQTNVTDYLQTMDAFVMPSNYEGLSLAVLEAQAAGLPCFISDKVPIECKKTDLVTQIPLNAGEEKWADEILSVKNMKRRNTYQEICDAGYDIAKQAEWLQNYYLSLQ